MTYVYYNAAFKTGKWQERTKDNIRVMSQTSVSMFYMAIKLITDKITVFWSHSANVCMCKSHYIPKTKCINPPTPKSSLFMTSEWLFVLFVWFELIQSNREHRLCTVKVNTLQNTEERHRHLCLTTEPSLSLTLALYENLSTAFTMLTQLWHSSKNRRLTGISFHFTQG